VLQQLVPNAEIFMGSHAYRDARVRVQETVAIANLKARIIPI